MRMISLMLAVLTAWSLAACGALVDPGDLAASFGEGVSLTRIAVELTDDPVTTGLEERLGWLKQVKGTLLFRPREVSIGDLPLEYQIGKISFIRSDRQ